MERPNIHNPKYWKNKSNDDFNHELYMADADLYMSYLESRLNPVNIFKFKESYILKEAELFYRQKIMENALNERRKKFFAIVNYESEALIMVEWLKEKQNIIENILLDLFNQSCTKTNGKYNHEHISAFEDAQRYLEDNKLISPDDCLNI